MEQTDANFTKEQKAKIALLACIAENNSDEVIGEAINKYLAEKNNISVEEFVLQRKEALEAVCGMWIDNDYDFEKARREADRF
jgi:hypothetical protein